VTLCHTLTVQPGKENNPELSSPRTLPTRRIFIDELSAVCQKNFIRRIDQVTNEVLNSPAQTRTGHQVSTPYPFTALAPSIVLIDCRSEGSLTVDTMHVAGLARIYAADVDVCHLGNITRRLLSDDAT
jgi:hypothetical protein